MWRRPPRPAPAGRFLAARALAGGALAAVLLGACSAAAPTSLPPASVPATDTAFPVTVAAANGDVTIERRPEAVVSLSPTATEMLFAVGAGDQVVAVDEFSYYPPEAPVTDLSGFTPNLEAITRYEPDLVVVSNDTDNIVGGLERLGIPVLLLPAAADVDGAWAQIEQLGAATGHVAEAVALTGELDRRLEAVVSAVPPRPAPLTYYHELDPSLYTATSATFIGEAYALLGLDNVADAADPDGSGYPQLSAEYLLEADPDVIFLADGESPGTVAARPGWADLTAVTAGAIFPVDADIASRWGPRIVDFLEAVQADLAALAAATP